MREAQARCDSAEFGEWMAFHRLAPFGPDIEDLRHAIHLACFGNAHRGKHARRFKVQDFVMGDHEKPLRGKEERWAAMKALFGALKESANGVGRRDVSANDRRHQRFGEGHRQRR